MGLWATNAFALICPSRRQSVLIDPGAEPERITALIGESQVIAILITHSHEDHIGAVATIKRQLDVPTMAHFSSGLHVDHPLVTGDLIPVGNHGLRVIYTPGHTDDSICYAIEGDCRIIVGDTIFDGGPGQTRSASDFRRTLATLRHIIECWSDDTVCHPGHGSPFRLGEKRQLIEQFLRKPHGDFYGDATWDM